MKKLTLISILGSLLLLSGCNDSTDNKEVKTNIATGYYVDSAVEGISYKCGVVEGNTTNEGAFDFEIGKDCVFSFGGFELRHIQSDFLESGINILENNEKIAQLLQTIDNDGNASNGIQLGNNSGEALRDLIKERTSDLKERLLENLPSEAEFGDFLQELTVKLSEKVEEYQGRVVTLKESTAHVRETIKSLGSKLIGKFRESNITTEIKNIIELLVDKKDGAELSIAFKVGNIITKLKELNQEIKLDETISQDFKNIRNEMINTLNERFDSEDNITNPKDVINAIFTNIKSKVGSIRERFSNRLKEIRG